jgi:hypothetical protein
MTDPEISLQFDHLVQPLHEALEAAGSWDYLDTLVPIEQLLLSFDYVDHQIQQGGFIQLFHNGYVGLLPSMPAQLEMIGDTAMSKLVDYALKQFVIHHELFAEAETLEDFTKLYQKIPAFEALDTEFVSRVVQSRRLMVMHLLEVSN